MEEAVANLGKEREGLGGATKDMGGKRDEPERDRKSTLPRGNPKCLPVGEGKEEKKVPMSGLRIGKETGRLLEANCWKGGSGRPRSIK